MFRFRLEKVLQQRRRVVDACSREVAAARSALAAAQATADAAARDLQASRQQAAAGRQGRLDPQAMARMLAWHDAQQARVRRLEDVVAAARIRTERAQERLEAAWRDREVLERLRARQEREWREEQARRERRALDEIGSIRAALTRGRSPADIV